MEKVVIIGGNAAGLTAAARAKRLDPRLDITVVEKTSSHFLQHVRNPVFPFEPRDAGKPGLLLSGEF
jgi:protoporphyrinogen oxidase